MAIIIILLDLVLLNDLEILTKSQKLSQIKRSTHEFAPTLIYLLFSFVSLTNCFNFSQYSDFQEPFQAYVIILNKELQGQGLQVIQSELNAVQIKKKNFQHQGVITITQYQISPYFLNKRIIRWQQTLGSIFRIQKDPKQLTPSQYLSLNLMFVCQSLQLQQFEKQENMQGKEQPRPHQGEEIENKYNTITYETRKTLIEMVSENGLSIYRAAKILNINHSTAKAILRKYRRYGHIFKRKHEDDKVLSDSHQNVITGSAVNQQQKSNQNNKIEQSNVVDISRAQNRDSISAFSYNPSCYYYYFPMVTLNWYQSNPYMI